MRASVTSIKVTGPPEFLIALAAGEADLREAAGLAGALDTTEGDELAVEVELAP